MRDRQKHSTKSKRRKKADTSAVLHSIWRPSQEELAGYGPLYAPAAPTVPPRRIPFPINAAAGTGSDKAKALEAQRAKVLEDEKQAEFRRAPARNATKPYGSPTDGGNTEKRVRLKPTVDSPATARKMEAYLQSNNIGLTDFACTAGTTDRTLRSFRKTGKLRRDLFKNVAKAMGTTAENLLK